MKAADLTGEKFGKLTVVKRVTNETKNGVFWLCKCDCGNESVVKASNLRSGSTKSCGCIRKKTIPSFRHGMSRTRMYGIWGGMKDRCSNPKYHGYMNYGGRGISVCEDWKEFTNFYEWSMSNGYQDNLSLDRIDVNGNYEPSNCRWTTMMVQSNNKRNNRFIEYNGERKTLKEWSRETGLSDACISERLKFGWSIEEAITIPSKVEVKYYEYNGEAHTIGEWAKIYGLHIDCLRGRLQRLGWDIEKALTTKDTKKYVEYNGEKKTIKEWADEYGLNKHCLKYRLQKGWDIEKALNTPSMNN